MGADAVSIGVAALIALGDNSPEHADGYAAIGSAPGFYDDWHAGSHRQHHGSHRDERRAGARLVHRVENAAAHGRQRHRQHRALKRRRPLALALGLELGGALLFAGVQEAQFLGQLARGDVADRGERVGCRAGFHRIESDFDGNFRAVFASRVQIAPGAHRTGDRRAGEARAQTRMAAPEAFGNEQVDRLAEKLGAYDRARAAYQGAIAQTGGVVVTQAVLCWVWMAGLLPG